MISLMRMCGECYSMILFLSPKGGTSINISCQIWKRRDLIGRNYADMLDRFTELSSCPVPI